MDPCLLPELASLMAVLALIPPKKTRMPQEEILLTQEMASSHSEVAKGSQPGKELRGSM